MAEHDTIITRELHSLITGGGEMLADEIAFNIADGKMFADENPAEGATLIPVLPLSGRRVTQKRKLGYPRPELPRFATGLLSESIVSEAAEPLQATIESLQPEKASTQHYGGGPWTDEDGKAAGFTPERPFFGVSDIAVKRLNAMIRLTEKRLAQELERVPLAPISLTVRL